VSAYTVLDRLGQAKEALGKARALQFDGSRLHQRFLQIAYIEGDSAAVEKEMQWYAGKPEEYISLGLQAANADVIGKRREAAGLYRRAAETALRRGLRDAASDFNEANARADALLGNCQTVRHLGRPAFALAICGDAARAGSLAAETSKMLPNGTLWNAVQLPAIRAAIELRRNQPASAVELLASATPYERSFPEVMWLRGQAYLSLGKGREAAVEFRKILDHKGANFGQFYALSWPALARAYALAGDNGESGRAYGEFFALWKNADSGLAVLNRARAEFASQEKQSIVR
jgi:predicted Zn-dependent protease